MMTEFVFSLTQTESEAVYQLICDHTADVKDPVLEAVAARMNWVPSQGDYPEPVA